jgi:hypothetical protein
MARDIVAAKYRVDTLGPLFHQTLRGLLVIGDHVEMVTLTLQNEQGIVGPMIMRLSGGSWEIFSGPRRANDPA